METAKNLERKKWESDRRKKKGEKQRYSQKKNELPAKEKKT